MEDDKFLLDTRLDIGCRVQDLTPSQNAIGTSRSLRDSSWLILEEEYGLDGGLQAYLFQVVRLDLFLGHIHGLVVK